MFTGLIESIGKITSIERTSNGIRLSAKPSDEYDLQIGDSIAVNGVCLTATSATGDIDFDVSPETMKSTNLGELSVGDRVNLERAMRLSDRLGGHIVTGHVDGVGMITDKRQAGEYTFFTFEAPPSVTRYLVKKGSIAVDGISLTVVETSSRGFSVAIIPHTLAVTNLGDKGIRDRVNLEADIIGKYVEKFVGRSESDSNLMELLNEKGFINE